MLGLIKMNVFKFELLLLTNMSNTASIDPMINFICDWLIKIGGVIALVGGVMFAIGYQSESAESKTKGVMTLATGFMVAALGSSKFLFGL